MTITEQPWTLTTSDATGHQLVMLPLPAITQLGAGDLATARDLCRLDLTPFMVSAECRGCWARRSRQLEKTPEEGTWTTRLILDTASGAVVGRAGFHGTPDASGIVEVGYAVDPLCRRRGHARAALRILLDVAADDPRVSAVRASVRPDNIPSIRLVESCGLRRVGEQMDPEDGLEIVYELQVRWPKVLGP